MSTDPRVADRLARFVEHHVVHGQRLDLEELCADEPELLEALRAAVATYERLADTLDAPAASDAAAPEQDEPLPRFEGFRTVERIGRGGAGDVYKLHDLRLGRTVAAKVLRRDSALGAHYGDFLREARALALFEDPRIVRVHEFRADANPPVLLMEYAEGFHLDRFRGALEPNQLARVMIEIAEALDRAHRLGIQHRDLKPSNVLLDASLAPKILDFGLSRGEPDRGHGAGTPLYMAPEQLVPGRTIDARSDVYALGVMLYQLLCGEPPFAAAEDGELIERIVAGRPRLPAEVDPTVDEPLQAIALKAMEADPARRYASARELALDLRRYVEGRPVLARPSQYRRGLEHRVREHLADIGDWLRIRLIYPHEAARLSRAYAAFDARDDDWIVESRVLSLSQIALYLGAFLLTCGALLYYAAYQLESVTGTLAPLIVLGVPCAGLAFAARRLFRGEHKPAAVAFHLAAVFLLPLALLVALDSVGLFAAGSGARDELFGGDPSNRQLQLATLAAGVWATGLALSTRTVALSSCATVLGLLFTLSVAADLGLRRWLEDGRWDKLALTLAPLVVIFGFAGHGFERRDRSWFARPVYYTAAALFVAVLELLALDGRAFAYLGLSLQRFQPVDVSDPLLLDTLGAMTLNGLAVYAAGRVLDGRDSPLLRSAAGMLFAVSPFAILYPLGHLCHAGEYAPGFDWAYLALALWIALASYVRQRRSFYLAGLTNTGAALWFITDHNDWFDRPGWAIAVLGLGLLLLVAGLGQHARERSRPRGRGKLEKTLHLH